MKEFLYLNFTKPYDDVNIFFGYFAIGSVVYTTIVFIFYFLFKEFEAISRILMTSIPSSIFNISIFFPFIILIKYFNCLFVC